MQLALSSITPLSHDVMTFSFLPPQDTVWRAGQSIRIELPSGEERRFSISSPPSSKMIDITTRKSNSFFKQGLWQLKKGDSVQGFNIEGTFIWHDSDAPHVLIAGGIGITPYIAMIKDRVEQSKEFSAELWYTTSDREPLFYNELKKWEHIGDFRFFVKKPFDLHEVTRHKKDKTLYYVSGPQKFVEEIASRLQNQHGISRDTIIKDLFTGNIKE